ncbi:MAG: 50S ribosomal protein L9 [Elusimicrobiales bacterium]|nr:50S ribosomal protein L9 [Elusimicrobiales bacterium]
MKVIIRKTVPKLGAAGDVKTVRDGYARNYLIPRGLAETATEGAMKNWKLGAQRRANRVSAETETAKALAAKVAGMTLSYTRETAETGQLFGSVGKADIWKSLKASGYDIGKDCIDLPAPVKTVGDTEVTLRLAHGVTAVIKVRIGPKAA